MFEFWKQPKFWATAIIILWIAYVIGANLEQIVTIHIIPLLVQPQLEVSTIVVFSAIVGAALTLIIQYYWRRSRASKNAAQSAPASGASSSTIA